MRVRRVCGRSRRAVLTATCLLAWLALSCTAPAGPAPASLDEPLVSVDALAAADGTLLLVDSRPRVEYDSGHVPGAVPYDTDRVAAQHARGLEPLVRDRLTPALEALGLDEAVPVVVVDDGTLDGFARAAETCWHVALVSRTSCHVLEGGLDAWRASGRELATKRPAPREPRPVTLTPRPRVFADLDWMRDAVFQARPLMDVQALPDAVSVPGSWRAPLPRLVDESGRVDREAVAAAVRLGEFERDPKRVVFGFARRDGAAGWYLFGPVSGLSDVRLFAGGMSHWWTVPDLPRTDTAGDASLGTLP